MNRSVKKTIVQTAKQDVHTVWMITFPYLDEFVDICLDFTIAQYMEDYSHFNIQKDFALSDKEKKFHRHTRVFNK